MNGSTTRSGRNQKNPWNKQKCEHNNPKSVGHKESSSEREIHSTTGILSQETRKTQINYLTLHLTNLKKNNKQRSK